MSIEIFHMTVQAIREAGYDSCWHDGDDWLDPGWYWWSCEPGCLPDCEPEGPFGTEREAGLDAWSDRPMPLAATAEGDDGPNEAHLSYDGDASASVVGDEDRVELGHEYRALGWLNSAHVRADGRGDRVTVSISVGDPRGAFCMTVERVDGELRLSVPHPDDSLPHMELTPLASSGYYKVG